MAFDRDKIEIALGAAELPVDDVKVVPVVSLTYDVVTALHSLLEHGVQHVLNLVLG